MNNDRPIHSLRRKGVDGVDRCLAESSRSTESHKVELVDRVGRFSVESSQFARSISRSAGSSLICSLFSAFLPTPPLSERRRYCVARHRSETLVWIHHVSRPHQVSPEQYCWKLRWLVVSWFLNDHFDTLSIIHRHHAVCVLQAATARRSEGTALYPVLSSYLFHCLSDHNHLVFVLVYATLHFHWPVSEIYRMQLKEKYL